MRLLTVPCVVLTAQRVAARTSSRLASRRGSRSPFTRPARPRRSAFGLSTTRAPCRTRTASASSTLRAAATTRSPRRGGRSCATPSPSTARSAPTSALRPSSAVRSTTSHRHRRRQRAPGVWPLLRSGRQSSVLLRSGAELTHRMGRVCASTQLARVGCAAGGDCGDGHLV
jgi:hypothetical protein